MFRDKTVLVTGATGLLGSNLVSRLIENGAKVIALGRNKEKIFRCFEKYIHQNNFDYYTADISLGTLPLKETLDYIFHAAGSIELKTIVNEPLDIIFPNILGTIACLDYLKKQKAVSGKCGRFIYFSSEAVYGKNSADYRVTENDTELADSLNAQRAPYSQSKRMAEIIVNGYCKQYGIDAVISRFSWVYGNAKYRPRQALFDFIESALKGENIIIRNSNTPKRDNIFIKDAIAGLLTVAVKGKAGEAYNISSNGEHGNFASADEIAKIIANIVNRDIYRKDRVHVTYETPPSVREGGVIMDNTKLKGLGWNLHTNIENGLYELIQEVKKDVY